MIDAQPKQPQILLCASQEQLERAASLFPKLQAHYVNGGDYATLEGRRVVCMGEDLAAFAVGYAAEVKYLPAELPALADPAEALAWAKKHAVPYTTQALEAARPEVVSPTIKPPAPHSAPRVPEAAATVEGEGLPQGVANGSAGEPSSSPPPLATAEPINAAPQVETPDGLRAQVAETAVVGDQSGVVRSDGAAPQSDLSHAEPPPLWDTDQADTLLSERPDAPEAWTQPVAEDMGLPENLWGHEDALPVLPPECYPDAIAAYVTDEAETMGCDPGMLALYCTAICAGAVTDEIRLQVKAASDRWQEPARVWMMVVGDSGLTMKSPTMDAAISHAWKIEREMRVAGGQALKDHELEMRVFEEQKQAYIKKRAKGEVAELPQEPPPPVSERLIIGNATLEAIADVLHQQGMRGALVVADELLGFIVGGMNQYKGGKGSDRTDTLELFNGGPRAIDRKGKAVLIKNWGASVMGGTQPDAIARVGVNLEADGLLQRFSIYLPHYAHKGPDRAGDKEARRRYHAVLDALVKLCARPDLAPVRFSPEASVIVDQARDWIFQTARESWLPAGLRSHLAKWPAMLARYCLTYAAIEAADERHPCVPAVISEHIAAQVWTMMRGTLWDHARHFYLMTLSGAGDKAALRQVAGLILAEGMSEISTRVMMQRSSIFRAAKPPEQRAIVAALCELGWLNPASGKSLITGIPTKYRVNELVHTRFAEIAERERAERGARVVRWNQARAQKQARSPGED